MMMRFMVMVMVMMRFMVMVMMMMRLWGGVWAVSMLPGKVGDEGCWHKCIYICIYTNLGGG